MIRPGTNVLVADNTGAKRARCFTVLGQSKRWGYVGDIVKVSVKEARPDGLVKKGQVCNALVVRTRHPIRRRDGSYLRFDDNAVVLVDGSGNPLGTRVLGPMPRELRDTQFVKILSLAPEVV